MSILNRHFSTPYNTAPFSKIKNEAFLPSFKTAIEKARKEIDAIVENPEHPTFKNTIEALEYSGHELDRISSIFFNLNSAETNDDIQKIAQEVSPLLTEFGNDITLNEDLFKRIKAVYDSKPKNLNEEQKTYLDENGAKDIYAEEELTQKPKLTGYIRQLLKRINPALQKRQQ